MLQGQIYEATIYKNGNGTVTKISVRHQNRSGRTSQNWSPFANFGPPSENVNSKQFKVAIGS